MQINIKQLRENPGSDLPFDFTLDISGVEPAAKEPLAVHGMITNSADVLMLKMTIETDLHLVCDRCLKQYQRHKSVFYETVIAEHIEDEESDDIIVCEGDILSLDDLAIPAFLLELDSKNLCKEDCKGLCPLCGTDLNESACNCSKHETDPRLEKLKQLLNE